MGTFTPLVNSHALLEVLELAKRKQSHTCKINVLSLLLTAKHGKCYSKVISWISVAESGFFWSDLQLMQQECHSQSVGFPSDIPLQTLLPSSNPNCTAILISMLYNYQ